MWKGQNKKIEDILKFMKEYLHNIFLCFITGHNIAPCPCPAKVQTKPYLVYSHTVHLWAAGMLSHHEK